MLDHTSALAFARANRIFPDGTTRVTVERDPTPTYMARGEGAWLYDIEGRRRLDLHGNFTVLIHGNAFKPVIDAVSDQLARGACFANPTEHEIALAERLVERTPAVDQVRFVNTGTEAVMFAVKAARAFNGRSAIAKIEGAYHGAYDWVEAGQNGGPKTWGPADAPYSVPGYRGTPPAVADDVVILRFNDTEGAVRQIERHGDRLAALVIDPMPSRAGLIPADRSFLEVVSRAARAKGMLVIADEVMNFRLGYSGASSRLGLDPDLITFGKIIGGGFPIGAIGGRSEVMAVFSRASGPAALPQGGTFSANPISMVAGAVCLDHLTPAAFERLEALGSRLRGRLDATIRSAGLEMSVTGAGSLLRIHPKAAPREYRDTVLDVSQQERLRRLMDAFATAGILAPATGMVCLSTALAEPEIDFMADVFDAFAESETARPRASA